MLAFEAVEPNGGAPTGGEEEEIFILGRFAPNRKSANVSVNRQFVIKGSEVGSKEDFVSCQYNASFHVDLIR